MRIVTSRSSSRTWRTSRATSGSHLPEHRLRTRRQRARGDAIRSPKPPGRAAAAQRRRHPRPVGDDRYQLDASPTTSTGVGQTPWEPSFCEHTWTLRSEEGLALGSADTEVDAGRLDSPFEIEVAEALKQRRDGRPHDRSGAVPIRSISPWWTQQTQDDLSWGSSAMERPTTIRQRRGIETGYVKKFWNSSAGRSCESGQPIG